MSRLPYPSDLPDEVRQVEETLLGPGGIFEIVEEEVGTLRRLVTNFSNFARLPHAELKEESLRDFLAECKGTLGHLEDPSLGEGSPDAEPMPTANVDITWEIPDVSASFRGRFLLFNEATGRVGGIFPPGYPLVLALGFEMSIA